MKKIVAIGLLSTALLMHTPTADAANISCMDITDEASFATNIAACEPALSNGIVMEANFTEYVALLNQWKTSYRGKSGYDVLERKLKDALAAEKVIEEISDINPYRVTSFAKAVANATSDYDKLPENLKAYVYNKEMLQTYEAAIDIVTTIAAINVKDTVNYKAAVAAARKTYDAADEHVREVVGNFETLQNHEATVKRIDDVEALIQKLNKETAHLSDSQVAEFVSDLAAAKAAYLELSSNERKLITTYHLIEKHEAGIGSAIEMIALIDAISPTATTFASRVEAAKKKYDALPPTDKKFVQNFKKLESYLEPAAIESALKSLKTTSATFEEDVANLRKRYNALTDEQKGYVVNSNRIAEAEQKLVAVEEMEKVIATLASATPDTLMAAVEAASLAYSKLDSGQRKMVGNSEELEKFEDTVKAVIKIEALIGKIDLQSNKMTSQVTAAQKAYDKLSPSERLYVRNATLLATSAPASNFLIQLKKLRTSSKVYREEVAQLRKQYTAFDAAAKAIVDPYEVLPQIQQAEKWIAEADYVDNRIANVGEEPEENYIKYVADTRAAFNALSKDARKLVLKQKELKAVEKDVKPILKTAELIEALHNNPKSLMSAFDKAQKSYAKLKPNQKLLVYNFGDLQAFEKPVSLSKKLKALKPTNKYFVTDLATARQMYDGLSEEQRRQVEGAYRLTEAEVELRDVNVVVTLIQNIAISSPEYVSNVRAAEEGYKQLMSSYRKLVVNYDRLKTELKSVKKVEKVIRNIDALDTFDARKLPTKLKAARKAYDKLEANEKPHVANYMKLIEYETAATM